MCILGRPLRSAAWDVRLEGQAPLVLAALTALLHPGAKIRCPPGFPITDPGTGLDAQDFLWKALRHMYLQTRNMPWLQVLSTEDQSLLPKTSNCIPPPAPPILEVQGRDGLVEGRRGHSHSPKERAPPKAIACHNSPALRPWVNICARCLFELLKPPYLPQNTLRAN